LRRRAPVHSRHLDPEILRSWAQSLRSNHGLGFGRVRRCAPLQPAKLKPKTFAERAAPWPVSAREKPPRFSNRAQAPRTASALWARAARALSDDSGWFVPARSEGSAGGTRLPSGPAAASPYRQPCHPAIK
jgi:hypothetical protein